MAHIPVKGEYIWLHGSSVEEICQPWRFFFIREYIHELIKDELYVDEEAMKKWTGSKQKITEVGEAAKQFLKSICYMDHAGENNDSRHCSCL